jgi:predicted dehydrogenase
MTIKLALIGCGGIARRHVLSMKDLQERGRGDFVVTAVCDANEAAAQEKADMFEELFGQRPTVYADHHAVIEAGSVDAVDLCLPHGLHHGISIDGM